MERENSYTLGKLQREINKLLDERPNLEDAVVLIDTEARTFNAHMIDMTDMYAESDEVLEACGLGKFVTIKPDYTGTNIKVNGNKTFEEIFKAIAFGMCIDEKPDDKQHTDAYNFLESFSRLVHKATLDSIEK